MLCGQPEQKCGVRVATSLVRRSTSCVVLQPLDAPPHVVVGVVAEQPLADGDGDVVRVERALHGEQPVAALVLLADADRLVRRAVQLLADLHFDERALLLDHDDEIEPPRELYQFPLRERPRAGDLVEAKPHVAGLDLVEPELVQGLADVEIGLADRDHAHLGLAAAGEDDAVEVVGPHEGQHGVALEVLKARLLVEHAVAAGGC